MAGISQSVECFTETFLLVTGPVPLHLLSPTTPTILESPTIDSDTSPDEAARAARGADYGHGHGTLLPARQPKARGGGSGGYFSGLFGALRNPHAEA